MDSQFVLIVYGVTVTEKKSESNIIEIEYKQNIVSKDFQKHPWFLLQTVYKLDNLGAVETK